MVKSVQRKECILDNVLGGQLESTVHYVNLRFVLSEVLSFIRKRFDQMASPKVLLIHHACF